MDREKLLIAHRDYYGQYHHHKEQMAYAATALYLVAAAWLMFDSSELIASGPQKCYRAIFIAIVGVAAVAFVTWQLWQRRFAANVVEACTRLLARAGGSEPPSTLVDPRMYNGILLPHFLVDELVTVAEAPGCVRGPRISELITYVTMAGTAILVILHLIG